MKQILIFVKQVLIKSLFSKKDVTTNNKKLPLLYFAPMEGITDPLYREAIMELYPQWDFFSTDFLRLPSVGALKKSRIISHIGENIFNSKNLLNKTNFQILTTSKVDNIKCIKMINELPINRLDLNLGCPSRKVNAHKGGSYLLQDLEQLKSILSNIRQNFSKHLSVKMRLGYLDTNNFLKLLKLFENLEIDQIIIHARTKKELYKGKAHWDFFKIASDACSLPLVFNGDINETEDIEYLNSCYPKASFMSARGALRSPWLAKSFKNTYKIESTDKRLQEINNYFLSIISIYKKNNQKDEFILKRCKSLSVYIIRDLNQKRLLLRSQSLVDFLKLL